MIKIEENMIINIMSPPTGLEYSFIRIFSTIMPPRWGFDQMGINDIDF